VYNAKLLVQISQSGERSLTDTGHSHYAIHLENSPFWLLRSRDSTVCIVTRLQAGRPRNRGSISDSGKIFFFLQMSKPTQGTGQSDFEWLSGGV
jgi:hypothetical protein